MKDQNILTTIGVIVFVGCCLIAGLPTQPALAAGSPEPKKTIAVVEFAVRGDHLDPQAGAIIADSVTSVIASLGYFTLKDRISLSAVTKIAKNNQLGSIGPVDAETAMQLGKLYGIHGVVTGTVSRLGDRVRVAARLIDTRTGTVLRSSEIEERDIDAVQVKLDKLTIAVTTMPVSAAQSWRALMVKTQPTNATVRLLNVGKPYQPGIRLPAGVYEIEVSHPGYITRKASARIAENDVTLLIDLEKAHYALAVDVDPPQSRISIVNMLNIQKPYQPGMKLETGVYQLEITCPGYRTERTTITIIDADVSVVLKLEPQSDSPVTPGGLAPTQTLQAHPTVRPPAKSTKPRSTRSVAANPPMKKLKTEGASVGNRTHWPHQGASAGNRANQANQPAQEGGTFKRALRQFRDDFKRAFW